MPNDVVASLIAKHLSSGLPHPGNPSNGQPAILIPLPMFRTDGMPPSMVEQISVTAKLVGEAIVNLIETGTGSELVEKTDLEQLRAPPEDQPMPVECSVCRKPMLWLKVANGRAVISARLLGGVNLQCPHTI
jgi:hypothetical protein